MELNNLNSFYNDSSSLTEVKLTEDQFNDDIINRLQRILNKEFSNSYEKRKIRKTSTGLNFACPCCHDSSFDERKKRGNLILKGKFAGRFKCFNCGQTMKFNQFFNMFDESLSLSEIHYINKELPDDALYYNASLNNITSQIINKDEAYKWALDREFVKRTLNLFEISKDYTPDAYNYLVGRCQYSRHDRFLYSLEGKKIYILNLIDDRIIGMQIRSIDANYKGPKYLTVTIDKLRKLMLGDNTPIPEEVSKLSCVFNVFQVDFSKTYMMPVLVAEGPFDAFLLPNCIAIAGASKNFNLNFPFWYIYDNDETGNKHAMDALKNGYNVFLWKKFKNDYNIPYRKKWDITDILKYLRDNPSNKKLLWSPYFSNNTLDGLYI